MRYETAKTDWRLPAPPALFGGTTQQLGAVCLTWNFIACGWYLDCFALSFSQARQDLESQHAQLAERIAALENALLDLETRSARSFASRTREVAILESEKLRGKKLIDHLRTANSKLMGDLNDARQSAAQTSLLEYRLQVCFVLLPSSCLYFHARKFVVRLARLLSKPSAKLQNAATDSSKQ